MVWGSSVLLFRMKITLCGSMIFLDTMKEIEAYLIARGHEVKRPDVLWPKDGSACPPEKKAEAIREHFEKVEWSDAVIIVNPEKKGVAGYIGGNTLMEMALAFHVGKVIYLTHEVPNISYTEEILGMLPRPVTELVSDFVAK